MKILKDNDKKEINKLFKKLKKKTTIKVKEVNIKNK